MMTRLPTRAIRSTYSYMKRPPLRTALRTALTLSFRTTTNTAGEKYVTLCDARAPHPFTARWRNTRWKSSPSTRSSAAPKSFAGRRSHTEQQVRLERPLRRASDGQPNQVYLLKQKGRLGLPRPCRRLRRRRQRTLLFGFPLERTGQSDLRLDGRLCRRVRGRPQKRHDDLFRVGKQRLCVPLDRRHGRRRARDAAGAGRFARQPFPPTARCWSCGTSSMR